MLAAFLTSDGDVDVSQTRRPSGFRRVISQGASLCFVPRAVSIVYSTLTVPVARSAMNLFTQRTPSFSEIGPVSVTLMACSSTSASYTAVRKAGGGGQPHADCGLGQKVEPQTSEGPKAWSSRMLSPLSSKDTIWPASSAMHPKMIDWPEGCTSSRTKPGCLLPLATTWRRIGRTKLQPLADRFWPCNCSRCRWPWCFGPAVSASKSKSASTLPIAVGAPAGFSKLAAAGASAAKSRHASTRANMPIDWIRESRASARAGASRSATLTI
mmetsp:Transcript_71553/g.184520  ORF Transcript_71553/g.184520 Transcript_71553/m.184520 type:complete len:269 (-) Transcript_71553:41-847(-)